MKELRTISSRNLKLEKKVKITVDNITVLIITVTFNISWRNTYVYN